MLIYDINNIESTHPDPEDDPPPEEKYRMGTWSQKYGVFPKGYPHP